MNADFHPADFGLDLPEQGMLAEIPKVRVPGDPFESAVSEVERPFERRGGKLFSFLQGHR